MAWTYHILTVNFHHEQQKIDAAKKLNDFGEEGWDLVNAHVNDGAATVTFFFKRKHPTANPAPERPPEPPKQKSRAVVAVRKARR